MRKMPGLSIAETSDRSNRFDYFDRVVAKVCSNEM